jgi:uncharacterized protein (TIGR02594 family)
MQFSSTAKTPATMLALLLACSALTSPAHAKARKGEQPPVAAVSHDERYPVQASAKVSSQRAPAAPNAFALASFGGGDVVAEARRWIGGNPTGMASLWCGAFMDFVLKRTGHAGGGNLASNYARYGTRVSGPQVGAIAVMARNGGGHVGVVSGIDANGDPIIISGNHGHRVAEATYPRGRIYAYVMPN